MPNLIRGIVPCFVGRLDRNRIRFSHRFNRQVDQAASDFLFSQILPYVNRIDDPDSPGLDHGRHGFPIIYAPDEESRKRPLGLCHKPYAFGLLKPVVKPLLHRRFRILPQKHIRTGDIPAVLEPCLLYLLQISTIPITNAYFHCEFEGNLR